MFLKKKKQEPEETLPFFSKGRDYNVYKLSFQERLIAYLLGFLTGYVVVWAFFKSGFISLIAGLVCLTMSPKVMVNYQKEKRLKQLREQFRDLLDSLCASYSVGKNTLSAFESSESDMLNIHGKNSFIVEEIQTINAGLRNNITVEALLSDFASRSGIEDIQSFADVFEVANRQGANLQKVVTATRDIIAEKMEMEMEINTLLAGNKNELNIMAVMPIIIVLVMGGFSDGGNGATIFSIRLGCVVLFVISYLIGKKITDIKI